MERILYGTDFIFTSSVEGGDKYLKQLSLAGSSEHVQLFTAFIKPLQSYSTFSFFFFKLQSPASADNFTETHLHLASLYLSITYSSNKLHWSYGMRHLLWHKCLSAMSHGGHGWEKGDVMSYRDLSFPHDAVCTVSILFVLLGLVVALFVAEQPQGLRALQLDFKLLQRTKRDRKKAIEERINKSKGREIFEYSDVCR